MSLLLALAVPAATAGAWIKEPGAFYLKGGLGHFAGREATAEASVPLAYRDLSASLYGEVGLPAALQLSGTLPWVLAENADQGRRYVALSGGDAELSLARRLTGGKVVSAVAAGGRLPLYGDRTQARAQDFAGWADRFPVPGDGTVDLDLRVEVGGSLPRGLWTQGAVGYRHRLGPWVDGATWSAQLGWSPSVQGRGLGWLGIDGGGVHNLPGADPVAAAETRQWARVGGFLAARVAEGVHVEAWGGAIPWARASRPGASGGLGLSWMGG